MCCINNFILETHDQTSYVTLCVCLLRLEISTPITYRCSPELCDLSCSLFPYAWVRELWKFKHYFFVIEPSPSECGEDARENWRMPKVLGVITLYCTLLLHLVYRRGGRRLGGMEEHSDTDFRLVAAKRVLTTPTVISL